MALLEYESPLECGPAEASQERGLDASGRLGPAGRPATRILTGAAIVLGNRDVRLRAELCGVRKAQSARYAGCSYY